jgi:hypothetical protein
MVIELRAYNLNLGQDCSYKRVFLPEGPFNFWIGEIHSFEHISGSVSETGVVTINIDLTSVQTNIDIRNERIMEHVFKGIKEAKLSAQIDMATVSAMAVGDTAVIDVEGSLSFLGVDIAVDTEMFVARLGEDKVMVTTNDMIFLAAEDAGIDAGVSKLMELAKLSGITRTSPVTLRLIFQH